jgi:hypothetical protein
MSTTNHSPQHNENPSLIFWTILGAALSAGAVYYALELLQAAEMAMR